MNPRISRSRRCWRIILPIVLIFCAIALPGNLSRTARAGDASLEFVGNLFQAIHNISLDRFDPTYPHCF